MNTELQSEFARRIRAVGETFRHVEEAQASLPYREGGWQRKQVIGHLLDSAANNHVRIVFAVLNRHYEGPGYDQAAWVDLHDYASLPWCELLDHWRARNHLLTHLVARLSEPDLRVVCTIAGEPVTVRDLILGYLDHVEHHTAQIASGLDLREQALVTAASGSCGCS